MKTNLIRPLREKAGLSQRALAEAVGTSQQQIARIEAGGQSVKIDMALRIAEALGTDLGRVFPEAQKLLGSPSRKRTRKELAELHYDTEAVDSFESAGVDLDPAAWTIRLRLRGGTDVSFALSTAEARRLRRNIADWEAWAPFFVFDSSEVTAAVNLNHLLHYYELWDAHTPDDWHDERVPCEQVGVWLSDSTEPLVVAVDPDEGSPEDEDDDGQLRYLLFMVQTMVEPGEFLSCMDSDGEHAFFRAAEVALITIPRRLLDPDLHDALYEAEYGEEDGDGPPAKHDERSTNGTH